jgi:hypothetical protein
MPDRGCRETRVVPSPPEQLRFAATMSALAQLAPELVAMIARGVSVNVASCDERLRPSVMRAMGSAVDVATGTVTVYLARPQAGQLLRDIEASGRLAATFSQPSSYRTVQLKTTGVSTRAASESDRPALERYLAAMEQEIAHVGHPPRVTRALLASRIEDLVAVSFEPEQAFDQTPGPKAGRLVAGSA